MTEPLPMTSVTDAGGRLRVSSGTPWEELIGYSRAVRVGDVVQVTGTVALGAGGELVGEGDSHRQTVQALANVRAALRAAGAEMEHVVRTRIYVTDIGRWEEVGRAHAEVFGGIRPATTMVQVAALIDPRMLVEVEAEAVVAG
jgi:enamine deaminase RidA (YjgF/YER057c/UK114 family)